ncbi:interleukin-12 subunit beta [Dunckerocampus dactyliophorus]|uniref:interleukin-12 subunit beta n=1 Tax=Dunckerocampus dactyliophorus TaxID=161453 RepID=UPI00240654C2|nr:interleukin-12 subunit beta [Dunckerocampus dactyliophorus]
MTSVQMFLSLLLVLSATFYCGTTSTIEVLMDNVVVLKVPHGDSRIHVPLTCGEAHEDGSVFWKKDGEEIKPALQGRQVNVVVHELQGGNYSCHLSSNGHYLNHTVVLTQQDPDNKTVILEEERPGEGHIRCLAPNYNGSFHCKWTRNMYRTNAEVLLFKAQRFLETLPCQVDSDGSGLVCQDAGCPYREEQHRISLVVYMVSSSLLEVYTSTFYLRDIVRPEQLPGLRTLEGKEFHWSYPESWQRPCTFFSLRFQVKVVRIGLPCDSNQHIMNEETNRTSFKVDIKSNKFVFCVRAQDKYTRGLWSLWRQCT